MNQVTCLINQHKLQKFGHRVQTRKVADHIIHSSSLVTNFHLTFKLAFHTGKTHISFEKYCIII